MRKSHLNGFSEAGSSPASLPVVVSLPVIAREMRLREVRISVSAAVATMVTRLWLVLSLTLIPGVVAAQNNAGQARPVSLVAGLSLGNTELQFDEKLDANTSFNTATLFASASLGPTSLTLSYADSIATQNVSEEDELGEASRSDLDLTLGYRIRPNWTLFAGYKRGETGIDFTVRDSGLLQEEYYRENGAFVGVSHRWRFARAGALSLSLAYIRFDMDLKFAAGADDDDEEEDDDGDALEFDDLEGTVSGDSDGYSAALSWVMPLSRQLAFRTQLRVNAFDLEVNAQSQTFRPNQRLTYFDVGLLYAFQ